MRNKTTCKFRISYKELATLSFDQNLESLMLRSKRILSDLLPAISSSYELEDKLKEGIAGCEFTISVEDVFSEY